MKYTKHIVPSVLALILFLSCKEKVAESSENSTSRNWLGKNIDVNQLKNTINKYHINDSTGQKIGSMVFASKVEDNKLISRDTSQFDNGAIYETAEMIVDLDSLNLESVLMKVKYPDVNVLIELISGNDGKIAGKYEVRKGDELLRDRKVDSIFDYSVFREEIYMLLASIDLKKGDSIPFKMFFPNNLSVVNSSLFFEKTDTVVVPAGKFKTSVVYLNTGGLLDNRIWVSDDEHKKLVKFTVPASKLSIELVESELNTNNQY